MKKEKKTKEKKEMHLITLSNIINFVVILMSVVGFTIEYVQNTKNYWTWVLLFFVALVNMIPDKTQKAEENN